MRRRSSAVLLLVTACLTAGCGAPRIYKGERTVRDQIVLPTPVVIAQPAVAVLGDLFVAIPFAGLARVIVVEQQRQRLGAALAAEGFDPPKEFQEGFAADLKRLGVPLVSAVSVSRAAADPFKLYPDVNELPAGAPTDCFIDALLVYGFVAPVTGASYEPYMVVSLNVIRGDDHAVTYTEKFSYNFLGKDIEVAPAAPLPSWRSIDAVERDIRTARDALRNAAAELSKYVSTHLQAKDHLGKC
jgi:hypothetical protein